MFQKCLSYYSDRLKKQKKAMLTRDISWKERCMKLCLLLSFFIYIDLANQAVLLENYLIDMVLFANNLSAIISTKSLTAFKQPGQKI